MARRRRRRRSRNDGPLIVGAVAVIFVVLLVVRFVATHPVLLVVPITVVLGGGALWLVRLRQRRIEAARQWRLDVARSQEIARYHVMGPQEFERALAVLCTRDGCTDVRVVGGRGDLGADVIALAPDGRRIVLQAKRYGPTTKVVGPDLQKFGGTCFTVHGAQVAAVVTTSTFTKQARDYALHMGIRLFDEQCLAAWASRTGPTPWH